MQNGKRLAKSLSHGVTVMYVSAESAMKRRRTIESPSCALRVMQQPDLGRLGRLVGPPIVTLGDIVDTSGATATPALTTSGLFGMSWTTIGLLGVALLGGVFLYTRLRGGGSPAPRRRRRFKLPQVALPTVALIAGGAYYYGKSSVGA